MAKEIFKNLPDTTTPLSASKLNGLFDGDEAMGNIVVDSITSKNLISGWYYGSISSTDGSDYGDGRRTDYMPVNISSSQSYKLSGLVINRCSMFVAAYNSSKQFLGRTGAMIQTGTTDLTLSSSSFSSGTAQGTGDIKYLRITLYAPASGYTIDSIVSSNSNMQLEKGSTATNFSPYQNVSGLQTYSTIEKKIGTWIDGKPLYRKVYAISNPSSSNTDYADLTSLNISKLIHLYGYYTKSSAGTFGIPFYDSEANYAVLFMGTEKNLRGRFGTPSAINEAYAVLEYTKTTD